MTLCPCDNSLCRVEYNNKKYFGNILTIFNYFSLIPLGDIFIKTIRLVLTYKVIDDFSVCHSFLICQPFTVMEFGLISDDFNVIFSAFFDILILINIFFILVFLEIIQINICKLNHDLKKNIETRAMKEFLVITNDESSLDEEDM